VYGCDTDPYTDGAIPTMRTIEKVEAAWKRVAPALDLFRPDGQLNDRAWAQEQVAWGLSRLKVSDWSKVRGASTRGPALVFQRHHLT
jgi:hypothetical protein